MRDYFIRRFLLIIPTLIGATLVVFGITRITPGGPLEAAMRKQMDQQGNRGSRDAGGSLTDEQKEQLAAYFGFEGEYRSEMTIREKLDFAGLQFKSYLRWLGAMPREVDKQFVRFE